MTEIQTKGIDSIRKEYLDRFNVESLKTASLSKANELFLYVIEDFKNGKLSSDELSTFGFEIFHAVAKHHPKSALFQATLSASELSFSIRSKTTYENISQYLQDIDNFYKSKR